MAESQTRFDIQVINGGARLRWMSRKGGLPNDNPKELADRLQDIVNTLRKMEPRPELQSEDA